jgi:hypothetical protein
MLSRTTCGPAASFLAALAALAAASAALIAAVRRWSACHGVSPGRMSDVPSITGSCAESIRLLGTVAGAGAAATAGAAAAGVGSDIGAGTAAAGITGAASTGATAVRASRGFRRRAGLWPNSWLSQSRSDSSEIRTPNPRSPLASASTGAPSRRNRSNSSRCGASSSATDRLGQRACATSSARVGVFWGARSWRNCGGVGVMRGRYLDSIGSAMGPHWERSKPTGLDVGVLTYGFLWFFLSEMSSLKLLLPWCGFVLRWFVGRQLRFLQWHKSVVALNSLDSIAWFACLGGVIPGFGNGSSITLSEFAWVGGGGC